MNDSFVKIEKVFNAPVNAVWSIWTEPEFISQWLGSDENGTVLSVNIDLSVGGKYEFAFSDSDGTMHTAFGAFLEIVPFSTLYYTWEWKSETGHVSYVRAEFISQHENTLLILTHSNLNPNSLHGYMDGWNGTLNKIINKVLKDNKIHPL